MPPPVARRLRLLARWPGELEPLGLAPGEGGDRLAEPHVAESDRLQGLQGPFHIGPAGEEGQGLGHRQLQDVRDRDSGAAVWRADPHLQHLVAIALAVAVRAAQVDVREELHLQVLEPGAAAGGAAPVAGVEAEGTPAV